MYIEFDGFDSAINGKGIIVNNLVGGESPINTWIIDGAGNLISQFDLTPTTYIDTSGLYNHQVVNQDFAVWRDYVDSSQTSYGWFAQAIDLNGYVGDKFQLPIGDADSMYIEFDGFDSAINGKGIIVNNLVGGESPINTWIIDGAGNLVVGAETQDEPSSENAVIITGTTSDDILEGTTGVDNISTLAGADVVSALASDDVITLASDGVYGNGYVAMNVSNNSSVGTNEAIGLNGFNSFSDVIDGGADVDTLNLTNGNDAFFIDDVYSAHHSSLALTSTTQGIDSIARITNLEVINAGEGNDIVDLTSTNFVLAEAVVINGEAGNDVLWGSNGNDTINGGDGDDVLFGGTGSDTLTGGAGSDNFQFTATAGSDVITDFSLADDSIQLYYRVEGKHTSADLNLTNGILTWNVDNTTNNVVIDLSATVSSSDLSDFQTLTTFIEIV
jgi:Ca2+-binding RTX toxin-like protein